MLFYTLDTLIYLTDVLFSKIHLLFKKKNSMFQWFQQPNYFYILYNLETKSYVITICIHASFCICVYGITKSWLSIINNFLLMVTKQTNNIHTYIHTYKMYSIPVSILHSRRAYYCAHTTHLHQIPYIWTLFLEWELRWIKILKLMGQTRVDFGMAPRLRVDMQKEQLIGELSHT